MPTEKRVNYVVGVGFLFIVLSLFIGSSWGIGFGIFLIIIGLIVGWGKRWKCDYCNKSFEHIGDCREHEKEHKEEKSSKEWKCDFCDKTFETKQEAEKHEKKCHKK